MIAISHKYCRYCCTVKPIEDFYKAYYHINANNPEGISHICKKCSSISPKPVMQDAQNLRVCPSCKTAHPLSAFYSCKSLVSKSNPLGLKQHCKYCQSVRHKKWRDGIKAGIIKPLVPLYKQAVGNE